MAGNHEYPPYSTEVPRKTGYYWWRDPAKTLNGGPMIVRVVNRHDGLAAGPWDGGLTLVSAMGGEWSEKLEAPR